MDIALSPTYSATAKQEVTQWIINLLGRPQLDGHTKPASLSGHLYINNIAKLIGAGRWAIEETTIFVGGTSTSDSVPVFTRLAILAAIAKAVDIMAGPLVERFSTRLAEEIRKQTQQVYGLMLTSSIRPQRLAVDMANCLVATEINGQWSLPSGAPAEVTESWIIMNF